MAKKPAPLGRTAFVTGAGGAVGGGTCRELAARGWRVLAGVRSEAAAASVERSDGRIVPFLCDITDEAAVAEVAEGVERELGGRGLDGLVNAAGIIVRGPLELVPARALRRQFEVNVLGHVTVTQSLLPALRRGRGRVVNVGGTAGRITLPFLGALSASKAALESVTDALRLELKHFGIEVSIVDPAHLDSDIFAKADVTAARERYAGTPAVEELYRAPIESARAALAKQKRGPVESAVKAIVTALTTRRPKSRYLVGRDARLAEISRLLPQAVRDPVLMRSMGLKKDVFASSTSSDLTESSAVARRDSQ